MIDTSGTSSKKKNDKDFPGNYPKILYKFRFFDEKDYHLRLLTHNEIFFSAPSIFNDPFDCQIPLRYDIGTKTQKINLVEKIILRKELTLSHKDAHREAKAFIKTKKLDNLKLLSGMNSDLTNKILGIFCLSENYSSILNWSHYSDSHRGFCIGFDRDILLDQINKFYEESKTILSLEKVRYSEDFPLINPYTMDIVDQLRTKSKEWEYEKEYRLILQDGANKLVVLPENAIRRVIVGCKINNENFEIMREIIRKRNNRIRLFKAESSLNSFKLNYKCIRNP
ncbi:DUF2971 domain-containing protein [Candidatus Latescibacterota bacterium]